jgi:hypothetical protein
MRAAGLLLLAGCVCVGDPTGPFACSASNDCAGTEQCVAGRCEETDSGLPPDAGHKADGGAIETNCANLIDDDGDGLTDCADPDCANKRCAGLGVPVCCGTSCFDTAQSPLNCGGCGLACATGQICTSVSTGTAITGTCGCFATSCPGSQICFGNSFCTCSSQNDCATGEVCDTGGGHGACRYP